MTVTGTLARPPLPILLDGLPSFSANNPGAGDNSHTVGNVVAAPDGTLFIGNGDASSYFLPEPGPGCTECRPDQSSFNAQNLGSPRGKIFHVNRDGSAVGALECRDAAAGVALPADGLEVGTG